jgi:hypothetical protein
MRLAVAAEGNREVEKTARTLGEGRQSKGDDWQSTRVLKPA